ncbi:hypothetical protein DFH06DRAFT_1470788 [Mycena polygramma]|nr:hypothetical protein DFH06DRAFT_1470788 [Mycena polygramma]
MSYDGSSRKRFRETTHRDELPPWEYDPSYGIVHPSGCSTCRSYTSHVSEAKAARSSSIEHAFKDLDNELDAYFFDGVAEGRRRQRADDQQRLRELERSRGDAVATVHRLRSDAQQLSLVKQQLRLAQSECDALRKRLNEKLENSPQVEGVRDGLEVERMLLDPCETQDLEESSSLQIPFPAGNYAPRFHSPKPEDSSGSAMSLGPLDVPSSTSSAPPRSISLFNLPARPTVEVIASSGTLSFRPTPAYSSSPMGRAPKTLRQLQYLMNRAHQPGNDECLAKVKMLCAEAHQTPREEKTELQRYILANWRNPDPSLSGSASSTPPSAPLLLPNEALLPPRANNPRVDDPVEVWHTYLTTHRGSWPRGVRRQADGSPHMGDLKASRTVARLRPAIGDNGDTSSRSEFMACAAQLFASPGMYQDLLRRNALSVAPVVSYKPYRATHFSITAAEVARHFASSGISVTEAVEELEPWALEYQAAAGFPAGSEPPRYSKQPHGGHSSKSSVYRPRTRYEPEDRFGWR